MIRIFKGSILDAPVDLIVSPANSFLHSTVGSNGGLAGVIERAALKPGFSAQTGRYNNRHANQFNKDCRSLPLIATGDAKMTRPGALTQFKGIIHAVGPIWGGGQFHERELLKSAYLFSLMISRQKQMSIALPAISAGIFGVPIEVVAEAAVTAAWALSTPGLDIYFALMDDKHVDAFQAFQCDESMGGKPLEVVS